MSERFEVDASTLDETSAAFNQAEAMRLLGSVHLDSLRNGTDRLTMETWAIMTCAGRGRPLSW